MIHPAMIELYLWLITGHFSGGLINYNPKEIWFLNNHGSIWIASKGKLTDHYRKISKEGGFRYKSLDDALKEDPINWKPIV